MPQSQVEMSQKEDKTEAEKPKPGANGPFVKEDTFIINTGIQRPEKSSAQSLRHRKALALAKANARHVIKSWQKRHQLLDNNVRRQSGISRAYVQHLSEAVQNEHGEKIYFRWEESGKINTNRQPKAVSKLYDYKRKRNAKRKVNAGDPESKSAPNRGAQDYLTVTSCDPKGHRVHTAVEDHLADNDKDVQANMDIGKVPESTSSGRLLQNQTRKSKRVEFDLPPQTLRGIKEAFLSNSAKLVNKNNSKTPGKQPSSANSKDSHPSKAVVIKGRTSDREKTMSDGQTDSDKENSTATNVHLESSADVSIGIGRKSEIETISHDKQISASSKNCSTVSTSRSRAPGNKPTNVAANKKTTNHIESKLSWPPLIEESAQQNLSYKNITKRETNNQTKGSNGHHENNIKPESIGKDTSNDLNDFTETNDVNDDVSNLDDSASESLLKSSANRKGSVMKENLKRITNLESGRPVAVDFKKTSQILFKNHDHTKTKSKRNIEKVQTNISKSYRPLKKAVEPYKFDSLTAKSINDSSNQPETHQDKSRHSIKGESEIVRGNLNTIIENSSEPVPELDYTRLKEKQCDLLVNSGNANNKSDIKQVGESWLFKQTDGKNEKQGMEKWDMRSEAGDELISALNKRQMTTMPGQSSVIELDDSLSISWPRRHGKSVVSGQNRALSRSDEKSNRTHRLDLTSVMNHQEQTNSPPLSINRDHHRHPDERKGSGFAHVPSVNSKGVNENLSFSRKASIDKTPDKGTPRSEAAGAVTAKPTVIPIQYSVGHSGAQNKHVGEDIVRCKDYILAADGCESKFQNSLKSDSQGESKINGVFQRQEPGIIDGSLLKTSGNSQNTDKISLKLDSNTARVNVDGGFMSTSPRRDGISDSRGDFNNDDVMENFKGNGFCSENDKHSVDGNFEERDRASLDKTNDDHELAFTELNQKTSDRQLNLLARPVSAGMSHYLNRASPWMDDGDNIHDDDIQFINDDKDYYEVFGYNAETTELLLTTQIFPVANFQDLGLNDDNRLKSEKVKNFHKPLGALTTHIESEENCKNSHQIGRKKSKFPSKAASSGLSFNGTAEKRDVVISKDEDHSTKPNKNLLSQEEMKMKARERLLSLALRTESDDSLYRHGASGKDGILQFSPKAAHFDNVFVPMESSSSTSSLITTKPLQTGIPPYTKTTGDFHFEKANTSEIDLGHGNKNETEKLRRFSRRPILDGVKVDVRHLPHDDLPFKKTSPPRPPPTYAADPQGNGDSKPHPTRHNQNLPHKHDAMKGGYLQRRRIFSESESERKKMELFTSPLKNLTSQEVMSMTALHEKANKPLTKPVGHSQNHKVPFPKKDHQHPHSLSQYPYNGAGQNPRGYPDTGQQLRKHVVNDVTTVLPFNYSQTVTKVKSRLVDQPGHKMNPPGHTAAGGKLSNVNNNNINNNFMSHQLTTINNNNNNMYNSNNNEGTNARNVVKQAETRIPSRDNTEKERSFKPVPNQHWTRQNESRPHNGLSNVDDHLAITKPRKLKPITHHQGIQKRHQHLASDLR